MSKKNMNYSNKNTEDVNVIINETGYTEEIPNEVSDLNENSSDIKYLADTVEESINDTEVTSIVEEDETSIETIVEKEVYVSSIVEMEVRYNPPVDTDNDDVVAITVSEFKYEVATDYVDGKPVNFISGTNDLDTACQLANNETKRTGIIHHVYNDQGFVVFSAKKKLTLLTNKKRGNKNVNWYS